MNSALYAGVLHHRRSVAPEHAFSYRIWMAFLDLDELPQLDARLRLFGWNRPALVGFRDRDHLGDPRRPLRENLAAFFASQGARLPGGPVRVLTHCRIFGYVFNPVSVFWCHGEDGALEAVVAEVNNTFGERHPYLLTVADGRTVWREKKRMHVSPFFSLDGSYEFDLPAPGERLDARIDLCHGPRTVMAGRLALRRRELTDGALASALVRHPLMTARVIGAIHWEALRLWRKGARVYTKPPYDPDAAGKLPA